MLYVEVPRKVVYGKGAITKLDSACKSIGIEKNDNIALVSGDSATKEIAESGAVSNARDGRRYIAEHAGWRCSVCGRKRWRDESIPLVLDHIDGNPTNWFVANLRLVCANCDAQLPTYKGRNRGNGRYARRQRYVAGKSY